MRYRYLFASLYSAALLSVAGCADADMTKSAGPTKEPSPTTSIDVPEQTALRVACEDSLAAVYEDPAGLSPFDASKRGEIVRCAPDLKLEASLLRENLTQRGFVDAQGVQSDVHVYRVAYRTERLAGEAGITSAWLLVPSTPIADPAPSIVFAPGFGGIGPSCIFTKEDLLGSEYTEFGSLLFLAGSGYPVIAPDYAGHRGNTLAAATVAEDEAHSLLDGTHALRNLLGHERLSEKTVLVGHSLGGRNVLAAQALAKSYGMAGELVAVLSLAPGWYPARFAGALLSSTANLNTTTSASRLYAASVYFYTHAELYDGVGSGALLFQPAKRSKMLELLAACDADAARFPELGQTAKDFFEPDFLNAVSSCGLLGGTSCQGEPAATWNKRFRKDRPILDPQGADVVTWQGAQDERVSPALATCAVEKIRADLSVVGASAKYTLCGDASANHQSVLSRNLSWALRWIGSRTLGSAAPEPCAGAEAAQPTTGTLACPPPGNTD